MTENEFKQSEFEELVWRLDGLARVFMKDDDYHKIRWLMFCYLVGNKPNLTVAQAKDVIDRVALMEGF